MKNQVLSIEQMQKLKELGVDIQPTGTCLMYTSDSSDKYYLKYGESTCEDDVKAFTLQDIVELLTDGVENVIVSVNNEEYYIKCWEFKHYEENELKKMHFENIKQIINACYEMLVWVAENEYLKTK